MGIQLSSKPTKTYKELVEMGDVKIPVLKRNDNFYQMDINEIGCPGKKTFIGIGQLENSTHSQLWSPSIYVGIPHGAEKNPDWIYWNLNAMQAPQHLKIKTGNKFELKFNYNPSIGNGNVVMALAKTSSITFGSGPSVHSFEILTEPIEPRELTGVRNSIVDGIEGTNPVIFTFKKDVEFSAGEYIFLMIGEKGSESNFNSFLYVGTNGSSGWYDPLVIEFPCYSGYSLDDGGIADNTGIIADEFSIIHGAPGSTEINSEYSMYTGNAFTINSSSQSTTIDRTNVQVWCSNLRLDEVIE